MNKILMLVPICLVGCGNATNGADDLGLRETGADHQSDIKGAGAGDTGSDGSIDNGPMLAGGWTNGAMVGYEDCSVLKDRLPDFEPDPGINCTERHLSAWLKDSKSMFLGAAIVELGATVDTETMVFHADYWETTERTVDVLSDSGITKAIFGDIGGDARLICSNLSACPTGRPEECTGNAMLTCSSGAPAYESWNYYVGPALAFFNDSCLHQAFDPSFWTIARIFPIKDDCVIDYDGTTMDLEEALELIDASEFPESGVHPEFSYTTCPPGLTFE